MKKLVIFLFMILYQPFFGQWVPTGTSVGQMTDIYSISENNVVTVGDNGTITKSTDGGLTWVQKNFNTTYNLRKVQFGSANVGYAIGFYTNNSQGILLKTTNAGENWNVVNSPDFSNVVAISVVNENIFYIVGTTANSSVNSELLKTIDGGNTFASICVNTVNENFQFINEFVGFFGDNSGLFKTTDGGATWLQANNLDISELQFIDENIGFLRAGGLYKTTDGGLTYQYLTSTNVNMGKMYASSQNVIWGITINYVLNGQPNYTMRGETLANGSFDRFDVGSPLFKAIHFANPTTGYAVDIDNGVIYKNTTGKLLSTNRIEVKTVPKIYPNPATDKLNVSFDESQPQSFKVILFDVLGKKIFDQSYDNQSNISINTLNFDKGIYFLSIITPEGTTTKKLFIN